MSYSPVSIVFTVSQKLSESKMYLHCQQGKHMKEGVVGTNGNQGTGAKSSQSAQRLASPSSLSALYSK